MHVQASCSIDATLGYLAGGTYIGEQHKMYRCFVEIYAKMNTIAPQ
jgi:hypothetical protein